MNPTKELELILENSYQVKTYEDTVVQVLMLKEVLEFYYQQLEKVS